MVIKKLNLKIDLSQEKDLRKRREKVAKESGDLEASATKEIGESLAKIKALEKKGRDRWGWESEEGCFLSVIFNTRQDMLDFVKRKGLKLHSDSVVFGDEIE